MVHRFVQELGKFNMPFGIHIISLDTDNCQVKIYVSSSHPKYQWEYKRYWPFMYITEWDYPKMYEMAYECLREVYCGIVSDMLMKWREK